MRSPQVFKAYWKGFLVQFDYLIDLRNKRIEFGTQERNGTRAPFRMINARPVVTTNLSDLALDSGAGQVVLFGTHPDSGPGLRGELRTMAGSQQIGMASGRLLAIEGRKIWSGDAIAIPNRPEPGVDGPMPLSLFNSIFVSNMGGYVVFE